MRAPRSVVAFVLSACAVLVGARRVSADDEIRWDGCGVGSYVHLKMRTTITGPDLPAMPADESESRLTLVAVSDDEYTLKTESRLRGVWQPGTEERRPRRAVRKATPPTEPKPEELGEETVKVDGTDILCKKTRVVSGGTTITRWTSEKHGVVKSEFTSTPTMTTLLTKLSTKVKVGSTEVDCRETTSTTVLDGLTTKTTIWTSDAVPDGFVRSETSAELPGGVKSVMTMETVAFEKK